MHKLGKFIEQQLERNHLRMIKGGAIDCEDEECEEEDPGGDPPAGPRPVEPPFGG